MKILVFGMTLGQSGQDPVIKYVTLSPIIVQVLRDLGHEVDTRIITTGEDLGKYDLIMTGLISPFSVAGKFIYPVISALDRYWFDNEKPVISFVDDWSLHQIDQNSRSTRRVLKRLIRPSIFARKPGYDWACTPEGMMSIARIMEKVTETGWPPLIVPLYGCGNIDIVRPLIMAEAYWPLDPVSYSPRVPFERRHPANRKREWTYAAIQDHPGYLEGLKNTWPVKQYGGGLTKRDTLIPVEQLVQRYADTWGVLSVPYSRLHGSGWWRERMVHSAMTRSVCFCDPQEIPQLGAPYQVTVQEIEAMTTGQLYDLADAQADALRAGCWDASQLHDQVNAMLASVTLLCCVLHTHAGKEQNMNILSTLSIVSFCFAVPFAVWLGVLLWRDRGKKRAADQAEELAATDYFTAIRTATMQEVPAMTKVLVKSQPEEVEITAVIAPGNLAPALPAPEPPPVRDESITLPMLPSGEAWTNNEVVDAWIDDMRDRMKKFDARLRAQLELV